MIPAKGTRFYHSRVLDTAKWDGKSPQLYVVTATRYGVIYYRPVYDYGSREALGAPECCSTANWEKVCKEITSL